MQALSQLRTIYGSFSSAFMLFVVLLMPVCTLASPPSSANGAGFDFKDDESAVNEQIKGYQQEKPARRVVTMQTMEKWMLHRADLLQELQQCYASTDPLNYKDKCSPMASELRMQRLDLQRSGTKLRYNTSQEKADMLSAAAKFDKFWPTAIGVVQYCDATFQVHNFAKKLHELLELKRWFEDKGDKHKVMLYQLDVLVSNVIKDISQETWEIDNNLNPENIKDVQTLKQLYSYYGLDQFVVISGNTCNPRGMGVGVIDLEVHQGMLSKKKMQAYEEAYEYFVQEITKFDPFFTKWMAEIEHVPAPFNLCMVSILKKVKDCQETFATFGLTYGEFLNEAKSYDKGLGALRSGAITQGNKWVLAKEGISYESAMCKAVHATVNVLEDYINATRHFIKANGEKNIR